ncbi:STAS domain-containing protein [Actinomadura sp. NTSP31]|uniref:STAS domain-containing protein n=1 Tax=Actinomadura sp. NTSP31 TaxID=1735447 RepID=UPI0035BF7536
MEATTRWRTPPSRLRTTVRPGPPRRVVLAGEVDILTAERLDMLLTDIVTTGSPTVEIDARQLSFRDASGLSVLVAADDLATRRGGGLTVVNAPPALRRLLRITGLEQRFTAARRRPAERPLP